MVILTILGIVIPIIFWIVKASIRSKKSTAPSNGQSTPQYYNPPPNQPVPAWETGSPPITPVAPAGQGIKCPFCGAMNPQEAAFCGNCASSLRKGM
nr:hypothetical protein [Candidatus Sigynarchaeota archaeon]